MGDYGATESIVTLAGTAIGIVSAFILLGIANWGAGYILRRFFPAGR